MPKAPTGMREAEQQTPHSAQLASSRAAFSSYEAVCNDTAQKGSGPRVSSVAQSSSSDGTRSVEGSDMRASECW